MKSPSNAWWRAWCSVVLIYALGIAASYGLALAGHPTSVWLWGMIL